MANSSTAPRKGFKEFIRKFFVSLKRSPQNIALAALTVASVFYTLKLDPIARTTATINLPNMGQCEFVGVLFSILVLVIFLRCFPRRQKPNYILIGLLFVFLACLIFADVFYLSRIAQGLASESAQAWAMTGDGKEVFIPKAKAAVTVHIVLLIIATALSALIPVYSKMLRKINTSIDVAGNENMSAIDLASDE